MSEKLTEKEQSFFRSLSELPLAEKAMSSGRPLYSELKSRISEALTQGVWKPGEAIASENTLRKACNVSIGTIRKAIDELVAENIVIRHHGRGTFVVSHDSDKYFFTFFRFVHQDGELAYPQIELLHFESRKATPEMARALNIGVSEKVWFFVNRLIMRNAPTIIDEITIAQERFPNLTEALLKSRTSTIYSFYQQQFGINVVRTNERVRAMAAKSPYSSWLKVASGYPLLLVIRTAYTYHDKPVELRYSYVNSANHEYVAEPVINP